MTGYRSLSDMADSLEWVAEQLRRAEAGDRDAASVVECFTHDWCGMTAIGIRVVAEDLAEVLEEGRRFREEEQARDQAEADRVEAEIEAKRACESERS